MFEIPIRKDEALSYLQKKYGETFTLRASTSISLDQLYAEMFFVSESHPNVPLKVMDDMHGFMDNYYGILIRDQYQAILDRAVGEGNRIFFRLRSASFPYEFRDPAAFPELLVQNPACFTSNLFWFVSDPTQVDEARFRETADRLRAEHITGMLLCYVTDPEQLSSLTVENWSDCITGPGALRAVRSEMLR